MPNTPLNPDGVLNAMDTLMAETDADERATEWAHKVTTRVLEGYFAVAQPVVNSVEVIRRLRRAMNGKYSSFDETYTIPRRDLEYLVLDLQGNNPFTEAKP